VILSLDQGTTSSRAIVFDRGGQPVATAQREFTQHFPQPGWVEHDPREIWESQVAVAREALEAAGLAASDLSGIGITNQRETAVVWDRATGEPVANAIVWQDRRTAGICDQLKADGHEAMVRERTGLVIDAYFSASKVRWLLDHEPGLRRRAEAGQLCFGTVDTWLVWKLTGGREHVTDVTNASRTMLFDIRRLDWDPELLDILGVPAALLPRVVPSSGVVAESDPALLGAAVPIAGIAGDQQAALFGQACFEPGTAKNTYGTGCFLLMNTGAQPVASTHGLLTTVAWQAGDAVEYALEGSIFIAGAAVQWLRDQLGVIASAAEVEALAAQVPDSGGVYLVPAFAGLGAPHWDPYARGVIAGLTRGSSKAHLARATLESIAFQTADLLHAMETDSGLPLQELKADGGASRNALLMQFQADLLGVPVVRPEMTETTALGAAYLAGLATGFWADPQEVAAHSRTGARFEPAIDRQEASRLQQGWQRAVSLAKGWAS
jgi:glycerol kinase